MSLSWMRLTMKVLPTKQRWKRCASQLGEETPPPKTRSASCTTKARAVVKITEKQSSGLIRLWSRSVPELKYTSAPYIFAERVLPKAVRCPYIGLVVRQGKKMLLLLPSLD